MELRVLKYFLTVAREGNITNAANFLHVTQPTISRQLQSLEDELNAQLFERHQQTITLTNAGMLLRKRAEEILSIVDKTEEDFTSMGDLVGGTVTIGGGESSSIKRLTELIAELQAEYPLIHYDLYSGHANNVAERLDKGLLDLGIFMDPVDLSKYNYADMRVADTWGVVMRKDCELAKKTAIKKEDLVDLPLILSSQVTQQTKNGDTYDEWFGKRFADLNVVATFNLVYTAAQFVAQGIGYMITFDKLVDVSSESPLCFRPLEPLAKSKLYIAWKKYPVFSPAAEVLFKKIQATFASKA